MNKVYKYPVWFNGKVYIYALIVGILFHSFPFIFGNGTVELSSIIFSTVIWLIALGIYVAANRNESPTVGISFNGIFVQKQLIKWNAIQSIVQATDGGDGILLLIPKLGTQLGNCLKITTNENVEFYIYSALIGYQDCLKDIEDRLNTGINVR